MLRRKIAAILLASVLCSAVSAQRLFQENAFAAISSPVLPEGFEITEVTGHKFDRPVAVAVAPDGRLFVAEQRGHIYIIDGDAVLSPAFLDLEDEVLMDHDRGLLGIAIDLEFESNGFVYLYYAVDFEDTNDTPRLDAFARLVRYTEDPLNPNVADPASRHVLLGETFTSGIPACYFSHNGGQIAFGSDGSLLLSTGDAAHYATTDAGGLYPQCFGPGKLDPSEDIGAFRALRIESLAGKILRVDPETGMGYPTNPFYTGSPADNASKVWAYGLRNPFRFTLLPDGSQDPGGGQPGTIYVADVGWGAWEELQPARGGENFAWPCYEGPFEQSSYQNASPATNGCDVMPPGTDPTFYWHHTDPDISVPPGLVARVLLGGDVYRGERFPAQYQGGVFHLDFVMGWMGYSVPESNGDLLEHQVFGSELGLIADLTYEPATQSFILVDAIQGRINRLSYPGIVSGESTPQETPTGLSIEQVRPNPSSHEVTVHLTSSQPGRLVLSVYDMLGRSLYSKTIEHPAGSHELQLDTRRLAEGVYRLVISDEIGARAATTFTVLR